MEAAEYLDAVRMITPTVSDALAEEIAASTHHLNEAIKEEGVPLQIHPNAVRRLIEANARLSSSETVEESHLTDVVELLEECLEQFGVTTEEEVVEYDVEVIETGRAKTDREGVKGIKTIIRELQEMYDGKPGAPRRKSTSVPDRRAYRRNGPNTRSRSYRAFDAEFLCQQFAGLGSDPQ